MRMPGDRLDRDDLIRGLAQLASKLHGSGQPAGIRIVGGAALALRYFDRRVTADIDAQIHPEGPVLEAAAEIADANGWSSDWLNTDVALFIPSLGADTAWETIYSSDGIVIEVASPPALLAMKLNASRLGRDDQDIANLLAICGVSSVDEAEGLFEKYYPGDGLPDKALRLLGPIFAAGLPAVPVSPPLPVFDEPR